MANVDEWALQPNIRACVPVHYEDPVPVLNTSQNETCAPLSLQRLLWTLPIPVIYLRMKWMRCSSWKARMMRLFGKNSGIDGRLATASPWTQNFPPISSLSVAPTPPEGTDETWRREKKKLKYLKKFCKAAFGLNGAGIWGMEKCSMWMVRDLWQWQVLRGCQVWGLGRCFAEFLYPLCPLSSGDTFSLLNSETSGQTLTTTLCFQDSKEQDETWVSPGFRSHKHLPHHEAQTAFWNTRGGGQWQLWLDHQWLQSGGQHRATLYCLLPRNPLPRSNTSGKFQDSLSSSMSHPIPLPFRCPCLKDSFP